jgi:hypothetical protein
MSETQLLIGSLSNDLFRVASLTQRGSISAAQRFAEEAKRWAEPLLKSDVPQYIAKIAQEIFANSEDEISLEKAEKYLMYGVLLQNYTLHHK